MNEFQRRSDERLKHLEALNEGLHTRYCQQSALAALAVAALSAEDLHALFEEAAVQVADTLGTEYSAVLQLLPDDLSLLMRAGVGWKEGVVGHYAVAAGLGTAEHFVLRSDTPVVVEDLQQETRFDKPPVLLDHRVVSTMNMMIRGQTGPWGILGVHTTCRRSFGSDDVAFLQSVANVLALAVERHDVAVTQRREQETLQTIFDNMPVMISVYDTSGRMLRVNREWERVLGWTFDEARHVDILAEAYPDPEQRNAALGFIQRAERRWVDFTPRTRDARVIDVSWARFQLSDGSVIGFGLDITERKQAERALAELQRQEREKAASFDQILDRVADGVVAIDPDWRYTYVNRNAATMLGRSVEDLLGAVVWTKFPEAVGGACHRAQERAFATQQPVSLDAYFAAWGRWFENRIYPSKSGLSIFFTDITERKRAEAERERLLESERIARAEAEAALERRRAIQTITDSALVHLSLDDLLRELLARLRRALDTDFATVLLLEEQRERLYLRAMDGYENVPSLRVPLGEGVSGWIAAEGRPLIVDSLATMDLSGIEGMPPGHILATTESVMGAPLRVGDEVIGVVVVSSRRPRRFTDADLELLLLVADRAAPAVERARLVETIRAGREQLETLSRRLLAAQEEERRRLAVELHDELGQILTSIKINLELKRPLARTTPHLDDVIASVDQAMDRVRDLALDLRPSVLDDLGLAAALRWYVDRFARKAQVEIHLSIDAVAKLNPVVEITCFRVAQEALTNVARHAEAQHVWFDLHLLEDVLELRIRDDGVGFDAAAARARALGGASLGLLGMEERASLVGGHLEVHGTPGRGTEVRVCLPLGESASRAR